MTIITKRRSFLTGSIAASAAALLPLTVKAEAADKIQWSKTYDVVVVGSGGAGLSAGVAAAQNGASTVILEKILPQRLHPYLKVVEVIVIDKKALPGVRGIPLR